MAWRCSHASCDALVAFSRQSRGNPAQYLPQDHRTSVRIGHGKLRSSVRYAPAICKGICVVHCQRTKNQNVPHFSRLQDFHVVPGEALQGDNFSISALHLAMKVPYFSNSWHKNEKVTPLTGPGMSKCAPTRPLAAVGQTSTSPSARRT
eukprot:SAG31_NODE_616_length_13519_cov_2.372876_1_plen_149_part_00